MDVYCGWPGSVNDARVWQNSPIYEKLTTDCGNFLPENAYLLGDSAYPLRKFIMVPFRDNGHLSREQRRFNARLSSSRVVIEQSYGRLKGIVRRLKYVYITKLTNIKYIIIACCILHNIVLKNKDVMEDFIIQEDTDDSLNDSDQEPASDLDEAVQLKNYIMNKICT